MTKGFPVFDAVETAIDLATTPLRTMIGLVQDLIGWINDIDFPDFPDLPGLPFSDGVSAGNSSNPFRGGPGAAGGTGGLTIVNVTVNQTVGDPVKAAREIRSILARSDSITIAG